MANTAKSGISDWTVADLLDRFGPIAHRRVRQNPPPGTATEQDAIEINRLKAGLFELVDGVLVEKAVGIQESFLASLINRILVDFAEKNMLGFVLGADGLTRLSPGLIMIPDVSFVSWRRFPNRRVPRDAMLGFAPDLAVEVLSPSNTNEEMRRKLQDYFDSGVSLVWYVDAAARTVTVYKSATDAALLTESDGLAGDPVLPGLLISLSELFAQLEK
jgi:Uma2 family endonuclease